MKIAIDLPIENNNKYSVGDILVLKRKDGNGCTYYYQIVNYPQIGGGYSFVYLNLMDFCRDCISDTIEECVDKLLSSFTTMYLASVIPHHEVLITRK